jgi:hypothetical protein
MLEFVYIEKENATCTRKFTVLPDVIVKITI